MKTRAKRDRVLAERLRDMRHRYGETQNQFARHFPVARQTYCGWERSGVPPGPTAMMVRLALTKLAEHTTQRRKDRHAARKKVSKNHEINGPSD
jgi:DNA-binding XRE family transcriptional regulator